MNNHDTPEDSYFHLLYTYIDILLTFVLPRMNLKFQIHHSYILLMRYMKPQTQIIIIGEASVSGIVIFSLYKNGSEKVFL